MEDEDVILSKVQADAEEEDFSLGGIIPITDKIFAPRTKDMEQDYYMPPELTGRWHHVIDEVGDIRLFLWTKLPRVWFT